MPDLIGIQPGRLTTQQILDAHGPESGKRVFPVEQFIERGHRVEAETMPFQLFRDCGSPGGWGGRHRDDDAAQPFRRGGTQQPGGAAHNRNAMQLGAPLLTVVIQKHHRFKPQTRPAQEVFGQMSPRPARTNDRHLFQLEFGGARQKTALFAPQAEEETERAQRDHKEHGVGHDGAAWRHIGSPG